MPHLRDEIKPCFNAQLRHSQLLDHGEQLRARQRITYTQGWDVENRLTAVTNTTTLSVTKFIYDGDGNRVKKIAPNGQVTIYPSASLRAGSGAIYEKNVSTGVTTTYYFAGSTRIATPALHRRRRLCAVQVCGRGACCRTSPATIPPSAPPARSAGHGVGSTSLTLDASGTKLGEMKYTPYGETRSEDFWQSPGSTLTCRISSKITSAAKVHFQPTDQSIEYGRGQCSGTESSP